MFSPKTENPFPFSASLTMRIDSYWKRSDPGLPVHLLPCNSTDIFNFHGNKRHGILLLTYLLFLLKGWMVSDKHRVLAIKNIPFWYWHFLISHRIFHFLENDITLPQSLQFILHSDSIYCQVIFRNSIQEVCNISVSWCKLRRTCPQWFITIAKRTRFPPFPSTQSLTTYI